MGFSSDVRCWGGCVGGVLMALEVLSVRSLGKQHFNQGSCTSFDVAEFPLVESVLNPGV